jgi:3-oxoacyl-[acyl-carrier-protein] synthase I
MPGTSLSILSTGMVSSVGLSAPAACAAIRSRLTNPSETRFMDDSGAWLMSHSVPLEQPWRGREKLARMAAAVVEECLSGVPREDWKRIPLLLCVSERARPGRHAGLDEELFAEVCAMCGQAEFAPTSIIIPQGRVSLAVALLEARKLVHESRVPAVLVVATDSLLTAATLKHFEQQGRLLTRKNSNGFIAGEAAAGLLLAMNSDAPALRIDGLGFATEPATVDSETPLRAEGLSRAITAALQDAGCEMHDLDYRISDLSGEQYYFKEAALALSRTLRTRKEEFDLWHPAECIGEVGAAAGVAALVVANAAAHKVYSPGPNLLVHMANDAGQRAAIVARFGASG